MGKDRTILQTKPQGGKRERTAVVVFGLDPRRENKPLGLSASQTHLLHGALRRHTLSLIDSLATSEVTPVLVSDLAESTFTGLTLPQRGTGFGSRFLNALADVAALGFERIVVVGTDTAGLERRDLVRAISTPGDDLVVGPSRDGGFYLLSLRSRDLGQLRGLPWRSALLLDRLREHFARRVFHDLACRRDLDRRNDFVRLLPLLRRIVREQMGVELLIVSRRAFCPPSSHHSARRYDPQRAPPSR